MYFSLHSSSIINSKVGASIENIAIPVLLLYFLTIIFGSIPNSLSSFDKFLIALHIDCFSQMVGDSS